MVDEQPQQEQLAALSALRGGTHVIAYITSTRAGLDTAMAMDVIPVIYEHLRLIETPKAETRIDLFIHSNGGDGVVPWRLVTLLREFSSELTVLVPNRAFSAATLTALGADKILMHPMGVLGPTDPTTVTPFNPADPNSPGHVLGISVEDVVSFIALVKEDVGIRHEDELVQAFLSLTGAIHPLALGNVKRSTSQSKMIGEKLLAARGGDVSIHETADIINALTSQLFYHGHPINRQEARSLGLNFVEDPAPDVEAAMWDVFCGYRDLLELDKPFAPLSQPGVIWPAPGPAGPPTVGEPVVLPDLTGALVESAGREDQYRLRLEVTARREFMGAIGCNVAVMEQGWRRVR